jgi:hypothetical protein
MASFKVWKELMDRYREQEKTLKALSETSAREQSKKEMAKVINQALGLYLRNIESHIIHLKITNWWKFEGEVETKAFDEWTDLFSQAKAFIKEHVGWSESAYFESTSDMAPVPPGPNAGQPLGDRERRLLRLTANMIHRSSKLQRIIEKRM